jgi:hypothetical protein
MFSEEPAINETGEINPEPFFPSSFYLSKEETAGPSIFTAFRYQTVSMLRNQVVPNNFFFQKNLALTSVITDFKNPVPLFIEGHALRH